MFGVIEGSGFEVLDPRFECCFVGHARLERLWTGGRWLEGPAWFGAGRYLVFSDIPNNRMMRFDETNGVVSVFRVPANNANGNTLDNEGRLVTCEHLTRRITRTEFDGSVRVIADRFDGARFNSPNDVTVRSDGTIWFTDPSYGIMHDYEGDYGEPEIAGCHVYCADPASGSVTRVIDRMEKPNGIAFSPDESLLYVADTGATHLSGGPRHIRVFKADSGMQLRDCGVFATCTNGLFDGFRVDRSGRIWASAADGVHCYHTDGTLIGKIHVPEAVSNLTFGGAKRNRLFITASTSLYAIYVTANGCKLG
ncbi:SMP-30/gluconolactonase/LRE family protein [Martelella alba]|uniref:SMP-30/gluconolactonase/LRE family protein n=1 Tax=Martelella alba TaxID=2590451 RepID=A0A506U6L2_9HYPH|nr:SMP-30/gluconolactonase/LRE family protein [Martelella alba]TPW30023.1 SMP-30/gluconolactonase/LRE family protein [Martelella alba]